MKILLWHVHGSWTTAFVQGQHEYYVPVQPDRGADGRGRALTWNWPESVKEVGAAQMSELEPDVVLVQRPHELRLAQELIGRRPGRELATVYLEHNAPQGRIAQMRHPVADRPDLLLAHVTHFNDVFWDAGLTPTRVIEHGIVDPRYRYTGELPRIAVVINEAGRRRRVTGTDLLGRFAAVAPVDIFGMDAAALGGIEDLPQQILHEEMARRRVYVHPVRWTSLGLSLIEAMHLGMPIVALATTEAPEAIPPTAGVISTRLATLTDAVEELIADRELATELGRAARAAALERYGLDRFLKDWDALLEEAMDRSGALR